MNSAPVDDYEFGPCRLEPANARLWRDGESVDLTAQQFKVLILLVNNPGRLITKQELADHAWERRAITDDALYKAISELNKALGSRVDGGAYIENVPKQGYRFNAEVRRIGGVAPLGSTFLKPGSAPPRPSLLIGREEALNDLKLRLGVAGKRHGSPAPVQVLTAVRGWPGVGKTSLAAALAHDPDIDKSFPDGVLWASLGQTPSLLSELAVWGRALGTDELLKAKNSEEASKRLTALLRDKRMLLIVDDVWEAEHALPFKVGGRDCALLVTTRETRVAEEIAPTAGDVYLLTVLDDEKALELLKAKAPTVVANYPEDSRKLARELEGLPLALQVAGHLLNVEASRGFDVAELIKELQEGKKLLEGKAPPDVAKETTLTVAVLFQRSTDRLDKETRDCFALLAPFAPKPATFDLTAMKAVWQVEDPKPAVRALVDRGLLEYVSETGRYQMHALLVTHARSLLSE